MGQECSSLQSCSHPTEIVLYDSTKDDHMTLQGRTWHYQIADGLNFNSISQGNYFQNNNQSININIDENDQQLQKRPAFTYESGIVYEGQWRGLMKEGYGIQLWPDGARYEGEWKDNNPNGKGQFRHADGDVYEGDWLNGKAHGNGKYQRQNGAFYEGQWKEDFQDGDGYEKWPEGSHYQGQFKEGKKNGNGIYNFADGSVYVGQWVDNKQTGYGTYTWPDGRKYEGEWLDNNLHGKGVYSWADGRKYEGDFVDDKKEGFGIYTWVDGKSLFKIFKNALLEYEGEWKAGKQHGNGNIILPNGSKKAGVWDNGKRIQTSDNTNRSQISIYGDNQSQLNTGRSQLRPAQQQQQFQPQSQALYQYRKN